MQSPHPSIPSAFRAAAERWSAATAIAQPDAEWSFREVDHASDRLSGALAGKGIRKGDRVALYCPNSPEFAYTYLGILKAGATVVPVNLLLNPKEIAFILADAGVSGLFFHAALTEQVKAFWRQLPENTWTAQIGQGEAGAELGSLLGQGKEPPRPAFAPADDLAVILYTSGTTGRPKGAMLTHANLTANARSVAEGLDLKPGEDRLLVVLPMFHAFAATVGMITPLLHGMSFVPVPRFEPALVNDCIVATGATVFLGVPSMYALLCRLEPEDLAKWNSVRLCVSGGAALPQAVMRMFEERFGVPILEGDGPTECSPVTCVNPRRGERKPGSVGLPVPYVAMCILDDAGNPVPDGDMGEVCVRGPNVMKGYWNLPEDTAQSFIGDWFRTGDLGYRDADGYFFLVDRKKDLIIVNGMNVYPRMIEEVLYRHPKIAEAAVVGEPHRLHGEIPVAHVVPTPGEQLEVAEVRAWCRQHLGRHEVPRRTLVCESLPKNAAGKILKRELRLAGELERGVDSRT
jgi:long-chain acyl-CoA synthetase